MDSAQATVARHSHAQDGQPEHPVVPLRVVSQRGGLQPAFVCGSVMVGYELTGPDGGLSFEPVWLPTLRDAQGIVLGLECTSWHDEESAEVRFAWAWVNRDGKVTPYVVGPVKPSDLEAGGILRVQVPAEELDLLSAFSAAVRVECLTDVPLLVRAAWLEVR